MRQLLGTSFQAIYEKHVPIGAALCYSSYCLCLFNRRDKLALMIFAVLCRMREGTHGKESLLTTEYVFRGAPFIKCYIGTEQKLETAFPEFLDL